MAALQGVGLVKRQSLSREIWVRTYPEIDAEVAAFDGQRF